MVESLCARWSEDARAGRVVDAIDSMSEFGVSRKLLIRACVMCSTV